MSSDWWRRAVVYQVYPKSFQDSNGDGVGDLPGVLDRLDHIKRLGADVIWLNPIYQNSGVDGGYDISDYRRIAPEFGTMADFDALLAGAHARGIRIVMDLVVNHTSTEHEWFAASRQSKDNDMRDFYIWRPGYEGGAPNGLRGCFSDSAWQKDEATGEYYMHMFAKEQADLNWDNPRVRSAVYEMMRWWLDKGIDGFRMDVIDRIAKPEPMLASDGGTPEGGFGGPKEHAYLREMNREVLSHYDVMTVGETGSVTPEQAPAYAPLDGSELSMVFQFEHMDADAGPKHKWTTQPLYLPRLKQTMEKWQVSLYGKTWNSLYWCNHDQPRIVSRYGCDTQEESRVLSAKMLGLCLHMMQGTPYIYQGEELGMTNYPLYTIEESQDVEAIGAYRDLVTERGEMTPEQMMACIRRKGRDNARTPMQWTAEENAGFTTGTPWMPVNPNHRTINAQAQVDDAHSVFAFYQKLIALRKQYDIITEGDFTLLMPQDEQVFAYTRRYAGQVLHVACNFSPETAQLEKAAFTQGTLLLGNYEHGEKPDVLRPWEARVTLQNEG